MVRAVLLDVNETLSDLTPLAGRFADVGLPGELARAWFAGVLRDGFAFTVHGQARPFAALARANLRTLLHGTARSGDEAAVEHVLEGFAALPVHDDVPDGLRALKGAGLTVATLSNGAAAVAERLLAAAGVRDLVDHVLSVEDAGIWKPARAAYEHGLRAVGQPAAGAALVAVHPWDTDGAQRAGLVGVWLDRAGAPWPDVLPAPSLRVTTLAGAADALA